MWKFKKQIPFRHKCKTTGQDFQFDNETFYEVFTIGCQADAKWTSTAIPQPCKCKSI